MTITNKMHQLNDSGNQLKSLLGNQISLIDEFNQTKLELIHEIQNLQVKTDLFNKTIDSIISSTTTDASKIREVLKQLREK